MAKAPKPGLMELLDGRGTVTYRQAQRDAAAGESLAHIAATMDALLASELRQEKLLTDMARMMWDQRQAGGVAPSGRTL